jgi:cytochrome c oxidase cbb3-type subunit III
MKKTFYILFFLLTAFSSSFATTETTQVSIETINSILIYGLLVVVLLLLILIFILARLSKTLFQTEEEKAYEAEFGKQGIWEKLFNLNPMSYEKKLLIEHDFDGIKELDNPTPPWFNFLFYSTIIIGVIYMLNIYVFNVIKPQATEYTEEVAIAEKNREEAMKKFANSINEDNVNQLSDKVSLEAGNVIYTKNCVACHGAAGQGGVGPNLTDNAWLHGGGIKKIFHTITLGVPQKGMIAWNKQLNPLQIQQVASYVLSLKGTNPPNAKAPQGEIKN